MVPIRHAKPDTKNILPGPFGANLRRAAVGTPALSSTLSEETVGFAYEYDARHAGALIFFDSWDHLVEQLRTVDFAAARKRALEVLCCAVGRGMGVGCTRVLVPCQRAVNAGLTTLYVLVSV